MAASSKKRAAAIERFLVEQAPPGQWHAVLASIQQLLPKDGALSDTEVQRLVRGHWARHGGLARREKAGDEGGSGSDKVLLHTWAEAEADEAASSDGLPTYVDPSSGRLVTVDHRTGAVIAEADAPAPVSVSEEEEERRAVAEAVAGYVARQYATEAATSAVFPPAAQEGTGAALRVAIYAEKFNLRSYWAGSWLSLWEVARPEGGGWTISGSVKVRAHYFEDGNMQMQTAKACPPTPLDSSVPLAEAVAAAIGDFEEGLQRSLDAAYAGLGDEALKALRRKLSLSKQRMDWDVALHRVSRLMASK